ncbi:MAG: efflux RND transporter periplasmic adaptor subunit [Gammaproteobacteria bacterium]|nr:efflux RND transporter periplasmic adaptor subunit [Gammaproteobacteria bacterium]
MSKKYTGKIALTVVFVALIGGGAWWWFAPGADKNGEITYKETQPLRNRIEVTILSTGIVQPENRVEIKPPIAGRVEEVMVKEGQVVKRGQLLARMSSTERAALLDAALAKGAAELAHWQELYKATPVLAPVDGTIILRNVEAGQSFTSQDAIFVMSDRLTIKAQVDETDIAQIKLKQKARIVLDAYPKDIVMAHVDQIAYDAKTVNNVTTYIVDVLPDRTPSAMRSGMTANVTFSIASKDDALLLSSEAIKAEDGKFFVFVGPLDAQGKPQRRAITVGISDGKRTEIAEGLTEQETVYIPQAKKSANRGGGQTNPLSPMGARRSGGR